jgi:tetratricopeptide (TPR) repeat protein
MRLAKSLSKPGSLLLLFVITGLGKFYAQPGEYYRAIHLAENEVILEKYGDAVPLYKKAFDINSRPFIKDLHNALLCSIKAGEYSSAKEFIDEILKFDIDTNFYYHSDRLEELHSSPELYTYFKSQFKKRGLIFKTGCKYYEKLLALDQSIRTTCKEINTNYYAICGEEIKLLDSLNLQSLYNHFSSYGVPDDIDLCQINPSLSPIYFLIIKHNMQWGRNSLDSILSDAMIIYRLHPQLYSDLVVYLNESYLKQPALYGMGYHIKLGERLFVFDVPVEIKSAINAARHAIYLDSIDDFNNKVKFQYRHPEFFLIYPMLLGTLAADPEMEKELAEKWKDAEVFKN